MREEIDEELQERLDAFDEEARKARGQLSTGLHLAFEVEPEDAFVRTWRRSDRRGIVHGKVEDFSPKRRKKNFRSLDLPYEGEYLLYIVGDGFDDYILKIDASNDAGSEPTVIRAKLR